MIRSSLFAAWLVASLTVAPCLFSQVASEARTQADRAFEEGKTLLQRGDWTAACARFAKSFELDPAPSTSIKLARCREHEGRFASADREYQRAGELNERLTERPERKAELAAVIRDGRAAIAPRVAYLRLSIGPRVAGLEVTLDGARLPNDADTAPLPVDPGAHEVTVRAPGYRTERFDPTVVAGSKNDVALTLVPEPRQEPATLPAPVAATATGAQAHSEPAPAVPPEDRGVPGQKPAPSTQRTFAYVVGGAGVVTLGVAGFFGIQTLLLVNESNDHCDSNGACDHEGVRLIRDAEDAQTVGFVCAGIGAALVGVAAGLYFTAPSPVNAGKNRRWVVALDARGATFEGSF
jgi:hypothetical protein